MKAQTKPQPAVTAPAPSTATESAQAPALEMPASGGCWVRNPDGSLSRDLIEHPEEAPGANQPKE